MKRIMKKIVVICMVLIFGLTVVTGCTKPNNSASKTEKEVNTETDEQKSTNTEEKKSNDGETHQTEENDNKDDTGSEDTSDEELMLDMEANPVEGTVFKDIKAKDSNGSTVTEEAFKGNKLTVVNIWGTFCSPCIDEMPGFEKVSQEYASRGVKFIGICIDTDSTKEINDVLSKLKVTYQNIIPDTNLSKQMVDKFDYVPVTLFLNEKGEVLKPFIPGGADEELLKGIIDQLLEVNHE